MDPDDTRRALAAEYGLRRRYASAPLDEPSLAGQVDLVLECSGHEAAALAGCKLVRKRGEVVLVGVPWTRHTELSAHDLLTTIFHQYAVVRSGWEWEVPPQPTDFVTGSLYGNYAAGLQWLATGQVRVQGLYSLMSPADCQTVYQGLCDHSLPRPAVVFDWAAVTAPASD